MRCFLLTFLLLLPLAGELLSDRKISAQIKEISELSDEGAMAAGEVWKTVLATSKTASEAEGAVEKTNEELAQLAKSPLATVPALPGEEVPIVDQEALSEKVADLIESAQSQLDDLSAGAKESPKLLADLTESVLKKRAELDGFESPSPANDGIAAARYQKALQEKRLLEAELKQFEAKRDLLQQKAELFDERVRQWNQNRVELLELQDSLTKQITSLKKKESEEVRASLDQSAKAFSDIPELAELNAEVSELNDRRSSEEGPQASLQSADDYSVSIKETRRRIAEQFLNAKRRIDLLEEARLGVDDKTGLLLRQQRSRLPSTDEISSELRLSLQQAAQAQLANLALSDRINSVPALTEKRITEILTENPKLERSAITDLLDQRAELLSELSADYRKLNDSLTVGTESAKLTIKEIDNYSDYIDERLLWIKSTKPIQLGEPIEEWNRIADLFSPQTFGQLGKSIQSNWFERIVAAITMCLVSIVIFLRRRSLRALLKTTSEKAVRRNCTSMIPTMLNIVSAIFLSLWLPLLVFLASMLIETPVSWNVGLQRLAGFLFLSSLLSKFSRKDGLFVSHFKMHPDRAAVIHKSLKWLFPFALPLVFLISALTVSDSSSSSGRLIFIIGMAVMGGFCHHLFHPKRSILQKEGKGSPFSKFCYFVILAIPIVFAVGAALGYFASVLTLRGQVAASSGLLILAFLALRFLMRCTLVSKRSLAITQALRRREVALAEREREEEGAEKPSELPTLEEVKAEAVDVVEVEEQTIQLLRLATYAAVFFGLWAIWSSTLPALSVLDKATLWGGSSVAESGSTQPPLLTKLLPSAEEAPTEGGEAASAPVRSVEVIDDGRVSLQDLILSLVFFGITFVAARNIPSLLSLTLFNRINLGQGGNFALTTTVRYLIVLVGVVLALSQIGITWGKVQWLAAAVTLGIGFGLQEIFANFVAGIIMLFERPVRLGDFVTVGEISGKVTQIKIRATTIQQLNNRELLVPNKEFITSQLVNWTLKDSVLRFEVGVGIAYGSDTEKATKILKRILKEHPTVLEDPNPDVVFVSFGNSTLDFKARGFVPSVDHLVSTQSDLHYSIDKAFREADIEIAFPQQDIHLRSLPEGMNLTQKS